MGRAFTGVTPVVSTTRGLVACEPHQADWFVPVLNGKPVKSGKLAARYRTKREAEECLRLTIARRKPMPGYKLGKRMGDRHDA